jgi:hypothetical protein
MAFTIDRQRPETTRLTMGHAFLPEDAWQIHELLERSEPGARFEVDFGRVRDCADFALSLLARDVLAGRVHIDLVGMTQHQERVLSYFGVNEAAPASFGDFDPI